jgi:sulfatase maturation enzyme AslB (radical SAM superfamily)
MEPDPITPYRRFLPPPLQGLNWRAFPLDGKLLLFDRDSGLNVLLDGDETRHFQRIAPRALLIAVTNACDLTCPFCYRDRQSPSRWRYESLLRFCQEADQWGVLEVAFGGGEPLLFPRWDDFIGELYATTRLSINFTTNGTRLTRDFLERSAGKYGQIRLSLYEDNHWPDTLRLLDQSGARFGVNWLITPAELDQIEPRFASLWALGVRDFLLISYKGPDRALHLDHAGQQRLAAFVNRIYQQLGPQVQIKLDVCWGTALDSVPRLFQSDDCGAGDDILSITSDKRIKPCSFHPMGIPFETLDEVRAYWEQRRTIRDAAQIAGCARLPQRGLIGRGVDHADHDLAAVGE